jgi:site-specific DNA recombinase
VTRLCRDRGWLDTAEFVDNDFSATNGRRRPAYQQMLTDIREGRIGAIAVWDLDRLCRQPRELEDLIDLADEKGLLLATVTGDADLSTDNGRLYARIKGAVGKSEVDRKSARQRAAARQRANAGKAWVTCRPFGYAEANKDGTGMQIVESGAALLRKAYDDVRAGRSLRGIANEWNDLGVRTPLSSKGNRGGNPFAAVVLGKLLRNPHLATPGCAPITARSPTRTGRPSSIVTSSRLRGLS